MLACSRIRLPSALNLIQCAWEASSLHAASRCQCSDALPAAQQQRRFAAQAAEASTDADHLAAEGAKELGLDRAELAKLKELSERALPSPEHTELYTDIPNRKKLTWGDIPAAEQTFASFHDANAPTAPVYDVAEWVAGHYPEHGYSARSPFYQWKQWADAHLPAEEAETYKAMDTLMADDEQRSAVLKTAQFELARLWDWQYRRAELGLPCDLPETSSGSSSSSSSSREGPGAAAVSAADAERTGAAGALSAGPATSAATSARPGLSSDPGASTDAGATAESASAGAGAAAAAPEAADDPFGGKHLKDVMAQEGAFAPGPIPGTRPTAVAADAAVDGGWAWEAAPKLTPEQEEALQQERIEKRMGPALLRDAMASVKAKLDEGRFQEKFGRPRGMAGTLQQQTFAAQSDDADSFFNPAPLPADEAAVAALPQLSHDLLETQARGVERWGDLPLLDRSGLHKAMLSEFMEASAHKFRARKLKWSLSDDGYAFDLNLRPPTATLQLLTDYLELKYADALLKRDAVESLRRRTHAQNLAALGSEAAELPPLALTRPVMLSAPERDSVTAALDRAFEEDPGGSYKALVEQLYADGLLTGDDMGQCCRAAVRRVAAQRAGIGGGAAAAAEDRDRLFAAIIGDPQQVSGSAAEQAKRAWEEAAQKLQSSWADSVWPFAHDAASASGSTSTDSSSGGSKDSSSKKASKSSKEASSKSSKSSNSSASAAAANDDADDDALAGPGLDHDWWQQPLSFEEARQQWEHLRQLAEAAGTAGKAAGTAAGTAGTAVAVTAAAAAGTAGVAVTAAAAGAAAAGAAAGIPSLEELLAADAAWRQGDMDQQELQALQRRLAPLQQLFALPPTLGEAQGEGLGGVDVASGEQLQKLFALPPTLGEAVGTSVREVMYKHAIPGKRPLPGSSLGWQELYQVFWRLYQSKYDKQHKIGQLEQQGQQQQGRQGQQEEERQQRGQQRRQGRQRQQGQQVTDGQLQEQGEDDAAEMTALSGVAGGLDVVEAHEVHLRELAVTPVTTPPYPGARKIVRFEQNLVLAAQPQARAQRKAALIVSAGELMAEAQLSEQALQHVIRICGRRYDPTTGDIRIVCDRFPTREENRRWCLEALHRLLHEGNARHPNTAFLFGEAGAAGSSAFL